MHQAMIISYQTFYVLLIVLSTSPGKSLPFVLCVLSALESQTVLALPTKIKIKSQKISFKEQLDTDTESLFQHLSLFPQFLQDTYS